MGILKTGKESNTPENPPSGFCKLYFKADGCLYSLDENGVEKKFEQGAETTITATINASSSFDLDVIPMSALCAVKYIVCISNAGQDKWRSFEMLAGKVTSSTVEDTLYARIGSILDVDVDFSVAGSDAKLIGTNNEAFSVDIKVHKTLI